MAINTLWSTPEWKPAQARVVRAYVIQAEPIEGYEPIDVMIRSGKASVDIDRTVEWEAISDDEVCLGIFEDGREVCRWGPPTTVSGQRFGWTPQAALSDGFRALVLEWLRKRFGPEGADEVLYVESVGDDWDGDTYGGYYCTFGVCITYQHHANETRTIHVDGEDMASLWQHVVKRFPPDDGGKT